MTKATTERISAASVLPGDTMWFSGYWCEVTEIGADGRVFGFFPFTPREGRRGTHLYTISKWTELVYLGVTIKIKAAA